MSAEEIDALLGRLGAQVLGSAGPLPLSSAALQEFRVRLGRPLPRVQMRRVCDGLLKLLERLHEHDPSLAAPVLAQIGELVGGLRLRSEDQLDPRGGAEHQRARFLGASRPQPLPSGRTTGRSWWQVMGDGADPGGAAHEREDPALGPPPARAPHPGPR